MKLQKIANPYAVFAIAWSLSLYLYSLEWAGIFPRISFQLYFFLITLIFIAAILAFLYIKVKISFDALKPIILNYNILLLINTLLWLPNFLYSGIPILSGLRDSEFGIPTVKTFITSFDCFLSVYGFYLFLMSGKKRYLLGVVYCFLFFVVIISRGNIVMSLATMFFLWINIKKPVLTFKSLLLIITGISLVMYLFGVAGNLRSIKDVASYTPDFDSSYNSEIILQLADASDSFRDNKIPNEFFWSYLYLTSPMSNLTYNVDKEPPPATFESLRSTFIDEVLLDAVSKRIDDMFNLRVKKPELLIDQLTVSTTLAGSYTYAGWGGMVFFMVIFLVFPIIYILLIIENPLGVIGISTLCTIFFFSMFDNMLVLSGLTPQLLYPILFKMIHKVDWSIKRN